MRVGMVQVLAWVGALLFSLSNTNDGGEPSAARVVIEWNPPSQPPLELLEMERLCTELLEAKIHDRMKGEVLYRRGRIRLEMALEETAKEDLTEALRLIPDSRECQLAIGRFEAWRGDLNVARVQAERMVMESPNTYHGYYLRAECEMTAKNFARALIHLNDALAIAPSNADCKLRRAATLINVNRYEDGFAEATEVLKLPPCLETYEAAANTCRGEVYFTQGKYAETISCLERAVAVRARIRSSRAPRLTGRLYYALWTSYSAVGSTGSADLTAERFGDDSNWLEKQSTRKGMMWLCKVHWRGSYWRGEIGKRRWRSWSQSQSHPITLDSTQWCGWLLSVRHVLSPKFVMSVQQ